jgi:hypothetical protein
MYTDFSVTLFVGDFCDHLCALTLIIAYSGPFLRSHAHFMHRKHGQEKAQKHRPKKHRLNAHLTPFLNLRMDSYRIYTADKALNPDFKRECAQGHFRPAEFLESGGKMDGKLDPASPYLLKNSSGLPALGGGFGCHVFDHTKAKVRDYWTQMCLNATKSGLVDGCGADASMQNGHNWHLSPERRLLCVADRARNDDAADHHTALGPRGVLLGKQTWEVGDYVNGALHEGCAAENATVITLRNLTAHWHSKWETREAAHLPVPR